MTQSSDGPAPAGAAHQMDGGGRSPLDALFAPRSVAVVGASDDPKRIGGRPIAYLKERFQGRILPISQSRAVVQGLPAVSRVTDLESPPDLVVIAVPARDVVGIARECADFGVRSLLVFTSGFAEASSEGAGWQRDGGHVGLDELCRRHVALRCSICAADASTPVTANPRAIKCCTTGTPAPQPRSRTRAPGGRPSQSSASLRVRTAEPPYLSR